VHPPKRINYDEIAHHYEEHRSGTGEIAKGLASLAGASADLTVLDVGCGTGAASVAFQELTGATVWGVDRSAEMLRYAREKSRAVNFVRADAHRLPFRDGKFDFAYSVLVIHHLEDVGAFLRELYRVMRAGKVAILTCSHDWIERHPMTRFFPSFASIDLARFPRIDSVVGWLDEAGFANVETLPVETEPYTADMDYVKRVGDRWVSTLQLLPENEFQAGLEKLRRTVCDPDGTDLEIHWEGMLLTGVKS
jgi:ubiquinone/menaquinone biosynthesis C-methylase UbiE